MGKIIISDARDGLLSLWGENITCCVTSPPYWKMRDYKTRGVKWADGWVGELGAEPRPDMYVNHLMEVLRCVGQVLDDDGALWLVIGDKYASGIGDVKNTGGGPNSRISRYRKERDAYPLKRINISEIKAVGLKRKDLVGLSWWVAFTLQREGWYLRACVVWDKVRPCPDSALDRPAKGYEFIFMFTKRAMYPCNFDDRDVRRGIWRVPMDKAPDGHFAAFPREIARRCIVATSKPGDIVIDPFAGTGTVGEVAVANGRDYILIEIQEAFLPLIEGRLAAHPHPYVISNSPVAAARQPICQPT